ncbi:hypothetical protein DFH06DRAFT_1146963 [Mycena polygramma]|nr:hypothetical protein DFH06DRAFT_1146963 [Mycena polygramma]
MLVSADCDESGMQEPLVLIANLTALASTAQTKMVASSALARQDSGHLVLATSFSRAALRRVPQTWLNTTFADGITNYSYHTYAGTFTRAQLPHCKLARPAAPSEEDPHFECQIWHLTNLLPIPTKILITATSYEVTKYVRTRCPYTDTAVLERKLINQRRNGDDSWTPTATISAHHYLPPENCSGWTEMQRRNLAWIRREEAAAPQWHEG